MVDRQLILSVFVIVLTCFVYAQSRIEGDNPCRSNHQLPCDDSQCIERRKWCDGTEDCRDKSDEKYCKEGKWSYRKFGYISDPPCSETKHFECDRGRCFPVSIECDGIEDCEDGSDERRCETEIEETSSNTQDSSLETTSTFTFSNAVDENIFHLSPKIPEITTSATTTSKRETTVKTPKIPSTPIPVQNKLTTQRTTVISEFDRKHDPTSLNSPRIALNSNNKRGEITKSSILQNQGNRRYAGIQARTTKHYTLTTPMDYYSQIKIDTLQSSNGGYALKESQNDLNGHYTHLRTTFKSNRPFYVQLRRKYIYSTSPAHRDISTIGYPDYIKQSKRVLSPFYFSRNYSEEFGLSYRDSIQQAEQYLISERNSPHSWGNNYPRALIALSLASNSFMSNDSENSFMKKTLAAEFGAKLLKLKREPKSMSNSKLASYINALMATCQNPKDFFEQDLTQLLAERSNSIHLNQSPKNPFILLTLCLNNITADWNEMQNLVSLTRRRIQNEADKDNLILATTALSCYQRYKQYKSALNVSLNDAFQNVLKMQQEDGSFGSLHSTALAAQSLMSSGIPVWWNATKTVHYLRNQQEQVGDGSFGDMLGTYLALPVVAGRSLLHLRNTKCDPLPNNTESMEDNLNVHGPKIAIHYTLKVGYPQTTSVSMVMNIPQGFNILQIMKMAEKLNSQYKFMYEEGPDKIDVHTLSGRPNDPEQGFRWHLYIVDDGVPEFFTIDLRNEEFPHDIRNVHPRAGQELIYWYINL